jgi:hypothetical protein
MHSDALMGSPNYQRFTPSVSQGRRGRLDSATYGGMCLTEQAVTFLIAGEHASSVKVKIAVIHETEIGVRAGASSITGAEAVPPVRRGGRHAL